MTEMAESFAADLSLSVGDFHRLSRFINDLSGIKMSAAKKAMVEGRLRRRVRNLGFDTFSAYCRFVFDGGGLDQEGVHIIDAVTTNKTEFFREPDHFRFLAEQALPDLAPAGRVRPLRVWSAACSTGAEPYTLAMVLETALTGRPGLDFEILATDLCTEVLKTGVQGIYPEDMVAPVPMEWRHRYLLRSRDRAAQRVRIGPELRRKVRFQHLNLTADAYAVKGAFDVIFCRNVLIYFDKAVQAAVLARLCDHLLPGGYLFIGHSETVAGYALPVRAVAPTVFVKV
jgi:chemotaxis protein methyltransferase CheR